MNLHTEPLHFISLGAGVQSSTMALMAQHGVITPMPSAAIFADTGDEPSHVYTWLQWLKCKLTFPVYTVQRSRLSEHLCEWGQSQIPSFKPGENGKATLGKRQCTKHWKIVPVHRELRRITNTQRKRLASGRFILWQGISIDEVSRMKDSRVHWISHRWPLIELRLSRKNCLEWMDSKGYPKPPKSACVFCPFQRYDQWESHKSRGGSDWETILNVDSQLADRGEFLTRELKRIHECVFVKDTCGQTELWNNECEGMCGV